MDSLNNLTWNTYHPLYKRVLICLFILTFVYCYFIVILVIEHADNVGNKIWPGFTIWFCVMGFIDRITLSYTREFQRLQDQSTSAV